MNTLTVSDIESAYKKLAASGIKPQRIYIKRELLTAEIETVCKALGLVIIIGDAP